MGQADRWGITFICQGVEDVGCVLLSCRIEVRHDVGILHGQALHGLVARQTVDRGTLFSIRIVLAEPVHPDEVERVDQHPADGVRRVMAVQEFTVIIDDSPGNGRPAGIGQTVVFVRVFVGIRDECSDSASDIIGPAESADDARFFRRIRLPGQQFFRFHFFAWYLRPCPYIVPVFILIQYAVGTGKGLVPIGKGILAVGTARGPIHQP